jgi:hypothetical protein
MEFSLIFTTTFLLKIKLDLETGEVSKVGDPITIQDCRQTYNIQLLSQSTNDYVFIGYRQREPDAYIVSIRNWANLNTSISHNTMF